ncbi:Uridine_phosphorylase 1 [Hexamita inflata]|uniref:Uridine phosphorylase 1 n=1 Tax=Hexamita inflata TaxID=28002 RepID=A0AA86R8X4_9EUKA|nr:Uridine phosphorylase 1 [Hexamita inflata]
MTDMKNANFPTDAEGRTYHLYLKHGEAASRVITVGDVPRAIVFAQTPGFEVKFVRVAPRLFTTITGLYKGTPVTIITSLMGIPNMDFTIRELRHVCQGPMAVVRVGTCGSPAAKVGEVTVPTKFHTVLRLPDGFGPGAENATVEQQYYISKTMHGDDDLIKLLQEKCKEHCGTAYDGHHVSCCSFYSSQGRTDPNFNDKNEHFIDYMCEKLPGLVSIEMESSHLVDMAINCNQKIHASSAHIILAQRRSLDFLTNEQKHKVEREIGLAALEAVTQFVIPGENEPKDGVWNHKGEVLGDYDQIKKHFE